MFCSRVGKWTSDTASPNGHERVFTDQMVGESFRDGARAGIDDGLHEAADGPDRQSCRGPIDRHGPAGMDQKAFGIIIIEDLIVRIVHLRQAALVGIGS